MTARLNTPDYNEMSGVLTIEYDENLDMRSLHSKIRKIIKYKTVHDVRLLAEDGMETIRLFSQPKIDLDEGVHLFSGIINKVKSIADDSLDRYDTRSEPWLDAIAVSHGKQRLALISNFLNLVTDFVKVNAYYISSVRKTGCTECGGQIDDLDEYCAGCGAHSAKFLSSSSFIDAPDFDASSKKTAVKDPYDKFKEKYLRYQGRLDVTIVEEDIDRIRKELNAKYSIPDLTEKARSKNLHILRRVLTDLSLNKYKDDLNILLKMLWGYELPDLHEFDEKIETSWRAGYEIIEKLREDKDPIGVHYSDWRLWRELSANGIECEPDDFQFSTNKDAKKRMENLWKIRCEEMGEKYVIAL